jgi:uncharacterized protein (TIGR02217 family)
VSGFHDVRLPLTLAMGASGGPERATEIVRLASGRERRNARWAVSRRRWEVGGAAMRLDLAHELIAFFEARGGRLNGFRFRDPVDWKSCAPTSEVSPLDQPLGEGDGERTEFQLIKRYASGGAWADRVIARPAAESVVVAVDGAAMSAFSIDEASGRVTFDTAPAAGAVLTAGFRFDTPVRFDADHLELSLEGHDAARVRAVVVEIAG